MSLLNVRSKNHPNDILKNGVDQDADDRRTPAVIFEALHAEHRFTIDVAASEDNAKLPRFFDRQKDGLLQHWAGERAWCNPPYSALEAWVRKAIHEVENGCHKVVMLLPANRTEQGWWQTLIEPIRDRGLGVSTRNLKGRPIFGRASGAIRGGKKGGSHAPFGAVVVAVEPCPRCRAPYMAALPFEAASQRRGEAKKEGMP